MANLNPSPRTRFPEGKSGNPGGKPPTGWLRDVMSEGVDGVPNRVRIARHLIEVATSWDVRVIGKGADGELLKVASGADSVAAARVLYSYDVGKPPMSSDEWAMALAEHFRQAARDQIDIALRALGAKASTMQPEQIAEFVKMCSQDARGFLRAAEEELASRDAKAFPGQEEPAQPEQPKLPATTEESSE
jgi:hypothetical protein